MLFVGGFKTTDGQSDKLEPQQDTPPTNRNKPNYVFFGNTIHIQTPVDRMISGACPDVLVQYRMAILLVLHLLFSNALSVLKVRRAA